MLALQYLQIMATIRHPQVAPAIANGQLSSALTQCVQRVRGHALRSQAPVREQVEALHACADICLLLDRDEDAEDWYQKASKLCGGGDAVLQQWSLRAAGLQALYHNRLETAISCLYKIVQESDDSSDPVQQDLQMEAGLLSVLIFHEVGPRALARQLLLQLAEQAQRQGWSDWLQLMHLLARDYEARATAQAHADLSDDIHWKSLEDDGRIALPATPLLRSSSAATQQLIHLRSDQIDLTLQLLKGKIADSTHLQPTLNAMGSQLTVRCREVVLLEMTQASLVSGHMHIAEILLANTRMPPMRVGLPLGQINSAQRQHLYCLCKLRLQQSRFNEGLDLYRSYSVACMQFIREHHPIVARYQGEVTVSYGAINDEISARLPARYRRAYQYMAAHLHRGNLSIAEVAKVIKVSERSLQMAFKEYVEISPREALRRLRMRKIHEELVQRDCDDTTSLMDVAMKYGVQNRTSLSSGYRKYFNEVPSATVARNG